MKNICSTAEKKKVVYL